MLLHAPLVSLVSQTASRCFFPWNSRIKIKPELQFIRHSVVQSFIEGRRTRLDWIPCFIFTTEEVSLAAPILSDLRMVLVEFDPHIVTSELECDFAAGGRATKWIEHNASTDRWQIGFPSHSHGLSWNILPSGILPTRLGSSFLLRLCVLADAPLNRTALFVSQLLANRRLSLSWFRHPCSC